MVGVAIAGGVFLVVNQPQNTAITITLPSPTPSGPIQAYVTGAVRDPGVYTLEPGSRVGDLLQVAQGLLPEADLEAINLARYVVDAEHLHVPVKGEPPARQININTATYEQLMALPKIGETLAQAIVDYRKQEGPFQRTDELMKVPDIGPATYDAIKDLVTIGGP